MHDDGAAKAAPFASLRFAEDRMPTRRDFALTIGAATLGACVAPHRCRLPPQPLQRRAVAGKR